MSSFSIFLPVIAILLVVLLFFSFRKLYKLFFHKSSSSKNQ
jgi:hypothetical protein